MASWPRKKKKKEDKTVDYGNFPHIPQNKYELFILLIGSRIFGININIMINILVVPKFNFDTMSKFGRRPFKSTSNYSPYP